VSPTPENADEAGEGATNSLDDAGRGTKVAPLKGDQSSTGKLLSQNGVHGQPIPDQSAQAPTMGGKLQPEASESDPDLTTGLGAADGVKPERAMELPASLNARFVANRKDVGAGFSGPEATETTAAGVEGLARPAMSTEARVSQNEVSSSIPGKHGNVNAGRNPGISSITSARSAAPGARGEQGHVPTGIQPPVGTEESPNWALGRDISSTRGTAATSGDGAPERGSGASGADSRDTFSALDTESASRNSEWIHAGAHSAEAGYQDATLGWVGVRADLGGGGIHASLVPATADAAQALGGHLAGLNAHLAERHTPVETLTLTAPENRGAEAGMNPGPNQDMRQGTGQGSDRGGQTGEKATMPPLVPAAVRSSSGGRSDELSMSMPAGAHISIMA